MPIAHHRQPTQETVSSGPLSPMTACWRTGSIGGAVNDLRSCDDDVCDRWQILLNSQGTQMKTAPVPRLP